MAREILRIHALSLHSVPELVRGNLLPKIAQWCCAHPIGSRTSKTCKFELIFLKKNHSKIKVKVNYTLEQVTKAQRGSRGIALHFL
jgi:hypothetical protein